jgi:hypothetical protein
VHSTGVPRSQGAGILKTSALPFLINKKSWGIACTLFLDYQETEWKRRPSVSFQETHEKCHLVYEASASPLSLPSLPPSSSSRSPPTPPTLFQIQNQILVMLVRKRPPSLSCLLRKKVKTPVFSYLIIGKSGGRPLFLSL